MKVCLGTWALERKLIKIRPRSSLAYNVFMSYQRHKCYLKKKVNTLCQSPQQIDQNNRKIRDMAWGTISIWIPGGKNLPIPLKAYPLWNRMAHSHSAPAQVVDIFRVLRSWSSERVKAGLCVCRVPGTTYPGPHLRIIDNLCLIQIKKYEHQSQLPGHHDLVLYLK